MMHVDQLMQFIYKRKFTYGPKTYIENVSYLSIRQNGLVKAILTLTLLVFGKHTVQFKLDNLYATVSLAYVVA